MAKIFGKQTQAPLKNYIINGDMRIAQRGVSFPAIATSTYSLDRWKYFKIGSMVHTITQDTDVPTYAESGYFFQNSLRLNLTTPDTSIAAGDQCSFAQMVEGFNFTHLAQKQFTISFWVKATLPGTYCVSCINSGGDRSFVSEYTINSPNTWERKVVTVSASPTAGTWNYSNGIGLYVIFALAMGSNFQATAGSWQNSNFQATSNQVNGVNTGATDFRITGVMMNEGNVATTPFRLFSENSFNDELMACQRYYEKSYNLGDAPGTATTTNAVTYAASGTGFNEQDICSFSVTKRNTPTVIFYSSSGAANNMRNATAAADVSRSAVLVGFNRCSWGGTANVDQNGYVYHWTADADF